LGTFNLRRIARPDELKAIGHEHLLALLTPYRDFFAQRKVTLPPIGSINGIPYNDLAEVFIAPGTDTPHKLVDALYHIHGLATPDAMDELLKEAEAKGIVLDNNSDTSPADVAVQLWLVAPEILERKHAEKPIASRRSFEYFHTDRSPIPPFQVPSQETLEALQEGLDDHFHEKRRGRGCRVFIYPVDEGYKFLVRHGDAIKRESIMEEGEEGSVFYRPAKHDVLSYDPKRGELCVNGSQSDRELYRRKFGRHIFGDEAFFPGDGKYTLAPLQKDKEKALVCTDIDGMEWVRLKEVRFLWGGSQQEVEIRKATNVFAALAEREEAFPHDAKLIQASFKVKFTESKSARVVTIKPSNIAEYIRDGDGTVVEEWLSRRGFVVMRNNTQPEGGHALVANA